MTNSKDIVPVQTTTDLEKSIDGFNQPMASYLREIGLPTEDVLYPVSERKSIISSLADVISILPIDQRQKAHYLTKFTVAIAVGLFDGALNYLWNETISALRRLVLSFDLGYFYSVLENINPRYRHLSRPDDLDDVSDHDLLEGCRRTGLLTDVNYTRLEHVNYMRNHASAAHPTEHEIDAFEILGWLRVCLRHAITAEPDHSVISIKRLIQNIRTEIIPDEDFPLIGTDIASQPLERIDDFLWTLFGMFLDPKVPQNAKNNIEKLAKYVWDACTEERKLDIGARFGVFRKNAEIAKKDATQRFLEIVNGLAYKDEDSLAGELIEKLEILKSVHFAWNNFYNEYPHARALKSSLPITGIIPRSARHLWVKVISICYIGNGHGYREGVDEAAINYYEEYINNFTNLEVIGFVHLFNDPEFTSTLNRTKPDERVRKLAEILKQKTKNVYVIRILDLIINAPHLKTGQIGILSDYKNSLVNIPKLK